MNANARRARNGKIALKAFMAIPRSSEEPENALVDLLTDLRHLCRGRIGLNFDAAVRISAGHFEEESAGGK